MNQDLPKRTINRNLMLACICLVAFANFHCGRSKKSASIDESKVTVLYIGDERVLGPAFEMPAKFLVFLPLVTYDETWQPQGRLAKTWVHSPDWLEWTIHLRTDVRWHDGVPVTASDVKFSLELLTLPHIHYEKPIIESITVQNDSTCKIRYMQPASPLYYWAVIYPKHLLEDLDPEEFWNWEFWTQPIGNGPFRYVRHVPKTMIELEANPDYYRGKPKIQSVVLKFGGSSQLTELLSGNVDALTYVNRVDVLKLRQDPNFRIYERKISDVLYAIFWNHSNPLFRDPMIRKALTLAINRRELVQAINYPKDVPIFDVIFTRRQFQRREIPEPLPYDPEAAEKLLKEAGWRYIDRDGVLDRNGQEFRFSVIVRAGEVMEQGAIYVQDQFRRVGIRMEVDILDFSVFFKRLRAGEFEAAIWKFDNSPGGDSQGFRLFVDEDSPIGYTNPRVVELLNRRQKTMDLDEWDRIYREIMPIFQSDLPLTFLFPDIETHVAHRRIGGLSNDHPDPVWFMEDLWIEDDEGVAE